MKRGIGFSILVAVVLSTFPNVVFADHRGYGGWRHDGGAPWWWIVPPLVYISTLPAYSYPDPQPVIVQPAPPTTVVIQPPMQVAPPVVADLPSQAMAAPMPPQYWYYCDAAKGYYPYVASCPSGWRAVPTTPPGIRQ